MRFRFVASAAAFAAAVSTAVTGVAPGGSVAAADPAPPGVLLSEPFTGTTLTSGPWLRPDPGVNSACLAGSGADPAATPVPGCGSTGTGAAGLQLTTAQPNQEGGLEYGLSLPMATGLDITFTSSQFGGSPGADGTSLFLVASDPTNPAGTPVDLGPPGAALGYAPASATNPDDPAGPVGRDGMADGYMGFGLDGFGNFVRQQNDGQLSSSGQAGGDCTGDASVNADPALRRDALAVRGPGTKQAGYCVLDHTTAFTAGGLHSSTGVPVEVAVNPGTTQVTTASGLTVPAGTYVFAAQLPGGSCQLTAASGVACLSGPLPGDSYLPAGWVDGKGLPLQLGFGFAASTGTYVDTHAVQGLTVRSLLAAPPTWSIAPSDDVSGVVQIGQAVRTTTTATLGTSPELQPVTLTATYPAGVTPGVATVSQPTGSGSCATAGAVETCTVTPPPGGFAPGTSLTAVFAGSGAAAPSQSAGSPLPVTVQVGSADSVPASAVDALVAGTTPSVTATISAATPTVAGVEAVPATVLAATATAASAPAGSAASAPVGSIPVGSIPVGSIPVGSIPVGSIPVGSIPVGSIPVGSISLGAGAAGSAPGQQAAAARLASSLLSDLSITYPHGCSGTGCTGWPGLLAGTPLAGRPLEALSLADVLADQVAGGRLAAASLGELGLASSPVGSIPVGSIALGGATLDRIGLGGAAPGAPALSAWCDALAAAGSSCAAFGIASGASSTSVTLATVALAGVPVGSIPVGSIPVGSIPVGSIPVGSIPVGSIPLSSTPVGSIPVGSIPVGSIPVGSIPVGSIPVGSIAALDAARTSPGLTPGETLTQLLAADPAFGSVTLAQLAAGLRGADLATLDATTLAELLVGDDTTYAGYPQLTLADLLLQVVPPTSYPWSAVDLRGLPLAASETVGGVEQFTATITVADGPTAVNPVLTLPATWALQPGAQLDGAPATLRGRPAATTDGRSFGPVLGQTVTAGPVTLSSGTHTLTFAAAAGLGLGPVTTTLRAGPGGTGFASSSATVDVVDGEVPAASSPGSAPPLPGGAPAAATGGGDLVIGYLASPGAVNDFTVTVPEGAELSASLSDLPAAYDLEVFGPPSQQLQGPPTETLPGVVDTQPGLAPSTAVEAAPGGNDVATTPPAGQVLVAFSDLPDGQAQSVQTPPLHAGTYTIQVSGYNGASSPAPYLLQAVTLGGGPAPVCPPLRSVPQAGAPTPSPTVVPAGTSTLLLAHTGRLAQAYGPEADRILADARAVAADSADGVAGSVVAVDAYPSVRAAYSAWDANPCSVDAANAVVAAIGAVVDQLKASDPALTSVVVIGPDDQIPFARIPDGAIQSNERDYGAATFAGQLQPQAVAESEGYVLSDDPLTAATPIAVGAATLYTPQLATGRLVESAGQIEGALTRFVSSHGQIAGTAGLSTGYSFLTSGSQAVATDLAADGVGAVSRLISEIWSRSDLAAALTPGGTAAPTVVGLNAHFDFSRALPAAGNASGTQSDLFSTADVRSAPSTYAGRLLFSMGCHSGLSVDSAELADGGGSGPVDDWAKTFADEGALWVGNTGYGYADTDTLAYSARLMAGFAGDLAAVPTIGEALAAAKSTYAASNAVLSPYDLKALMEATYYGLPMYRLAVPHAAPTAPAPVPLTSGPAAGISAAPLAASLPIGGGPGGLQQVTTAAGSTYYRVGTTDPAQPGTQATEFRPIEPLDVVPATQPGQVAHGVLITALSSTDVPATSPAFSLPAVGSRGSAAPATGSAAFPGTLGRVATSTTYTTSGTATAAQVDLVAGQFIPAPGAPGTGTERLFTSIGGQVLYVPTASALADDHDPAAISSSSVVANGGTLAATVTVAPSSAADPVVAVVVLVTDAANPGSYSSLDLTPVAPGSTTFTGSASSAATGVQYIVEAVDQAGNVATSNDQGRDFSSTPAAPVQVTLSGSPVVGGSYSGPVTATVTPAGGATYVLDGASAAPVPADGIAVSVAGPHDLTVTGADASTATVEFSIATNGTTTTVTAPAATAPSGVPVTFTATVVAASSGQAAPTGAVTFIDGVTPLACSPVALQPTSGQSATAACSAPLSAGVHRIGATYQGAGGLAGSTSAAPAIVTARPVPSQATLASSANPAVVGQAVTYTATVADGGGPAPTGGVDFLDGGQPIAGCTGRALAPTANGQTATATCSATYAATGSHSVTAAYGGDVAHGGSTSPAVAETVAVAPTAITLTVPSGPVVTGTPVTLTASVAVTAGATTPTGAVTFSDGGHAIAGCGGGTTSAERRSTGANLLTVTCATTFAGAGATHALTAAYAGDATSASSAVAAAAQVVVDVATSTSLVSSAPLTQARSAVTLTATVTAVAPGTGTPTGTVTVGIAGAGALPGCANLTLSGGRASCAASWSSAAGHNLVATFTPGGYAVGSTSPVITEVVSATPCRTLAGCNLKGIDLTGAQLAGADLSGANLMGAVLASANLRGTSFKGANLSDADLDHASAASVVLTGANLLSADLTAMSAPGATATGANLSQTTARSVVLTSANLNGASFARADLTGANLAGASEAGTDFSGATTTGATMS